MFGETDTETFFRLRRIEMLAPEINKVGGQIIFTCFTSMFCPTCDKALYDCVVFRPVNPQSLVNSIADALNARVALDWALLATKGYETSLV